jgi:hypothetical protein
MHELVLSATPKPDSRMIGEEGGGAVAEPPLLRIVAGGEPAADELAALVIAVASAASAVPAPDSTGRKRGGWSDRSHGLRRPLRAGVGAWRSARD